MPRPYEKIESIQRDLGELKEEIRLDRIEGVDTKVVENVIIVLEGSLNMLDAIHNNIGECVRRLKVAMPPDTRDPRDPREEPPARPSLEPPQTPFTGT